MDDVRIIFTASKTPLGVLIRKITKSPVSHVMIEIPVWSRRMIAEATIGGTRFVPSYRSRHHVVVEYKCNFEYKDGLCKIADELGSHYDYAGLFIIVFAKLTWRWFKNKLKNLKWDDKSIKCSGLVALFLKINRIDGSESFNIELVTPEDILEFCENHKDLFEKIGS